MSSPLVENAQEEVKPQKPSERDLIIRYYARFRKAQQAVQEKHEKWRILDMFDRGEQWSDSAIPPWVPKPVTNWIRYVRTLKRANLASAIPMAEFIAEHPDDALLVEQLYRAYEHVWQKENVQRTIRRCIDRAILQGTAIVYVYSTDEVRGKYYGENDPRNRLYQGRICVERFPNANFFPDPDAYRLEDCKWIETTELVPLAWVKNNPAFIEYTKEQGTYQKLQQLQTNTEKDASGTIFDRDNDPTNETMIQSGDEMVTLHTHWERYMDENGKWHLDVSYYLRDTDFFLLRIEDVQPNEYPFAVLYDEEEENDFWGTSTCMDILENQKIINKADQVITILGVLHQNPQKVVSRESGINAQELARTGTLPGKVWTANGDPSRAIHIVDPPEIPRGLFEVKNAVSNDIREISGINEAYVGESVGSLTTSTGVNSLIERATIRDRDKMIQIDEFVERISQLIALHILYKWKEPRKIAVVGSDGQPQFFDFEPFDDLTIENLEWRVRSNVFAKAPITQAARRQQADKLLQMQGQFQFDPPVITPEEWVKMQDFDLKNEILQRIQEDRARKEALQTQDMAAKLLALAQQLHELMMQNVPPEQQEQIALQMAQQLLNPQQQQSGRRPNAPGSPQLPRGVTDQVAMANMANGF